MNRPVGTQTRKIINRQFSLEARLGYGWMILLRMA